MSGEPFVFPGSPEQYGGITDLTDARLLAGQLEWAASSPEAAEPGVQHRQRDVFRWRRMWAVVAEGLGYRWRSTRGTPSRWRSVSPTPAWDRIVAKTTACDRTPWQHRLLVAHRRRSGPGDGDLRGHDQEPLARIPGGQDTRRSFLDLFDELRSERIIPPLD